MDGSEKRNTQFSKSVVKSFLTVILSVCITVGLTSCSGKPGQDTKKLEPAPRPAEPNNVVQRQPAEPNNAAKQPIPEPIWGPEVNGVCAAFEFVPKKDSYAIGETIGTKIFIKNFSGQAINKIKAIGQSFYGHSVITAADPNVPRMAEVNWLQGWPSDPNKMIEAGEVLAYQAEIQVRRFNDDGTYPPRKAPNIVYFFPGEYKLYFTLECGRKFTLITGEHKFVIVDANE
jgi:hypothetical protein